MTTARAERTGRSVTSGPKSHPWQRLAAQGTAKGLCGFALPERALRLRAPLAGSTEKGNAMRKFATATALGAWMALIAAPALAADAAKEIKTAALHAGMASTSDTLQMTRAHLHHTLNCLEGPKGANFDATALNPCKDQGMGAIPDSPPDKRKALEAVADQARMALAEPDLAKAKAMAAQVRKSLGE